MSFDVYGVGNALVDIQARVDEALVARLGFARGGMTLVDSDVQRRVLGELQGCSTSRCPGGSAANTVIAVADFGGKAAFAGKVANNELGDFFLRDMRNIGLTIEVPPAAEGSTGSCVVLITPDAQRTMLTSLGVSATLGPGDIRAEEIRKAKYVYIEGYLFAGESTRAAALRAIELAKEHGVKVAFTVSDPWLISAHKDEFWRLIEGPIDLLFCNLQEAQSLTGREDPIECAADIHRHASNVALTLGHQGSLLMHDGEVTAIEGVPVEAVDSTGAGDMYAGALLYGITNGLTWKQAGHLASHAAARIVGQMGARLQRPFTKAEVAELLR